MFLIRERDFSQDEREFITLDYNSYNRKLVFNFLSQFEGYRHGSFVESLLSIVEVLGSIPSIARKKKKKKKLTGNKVRTIQCSEPV